MKLAWVVRGAAMALLAAWAVGLAAAAVHLAAWDRELVQVLLQIRADRTFRVRMAERREPVPREWYRSKALALLAAGERLHDDGRWTVFLPGAWPRFDDLRQRLAQRVEREFSEIAVETIRRELDDRAGRLAGVARHAATGELQAVPCAEPALAPSFFQPGTSGGDLPEVRGVLAHLEEIEQLDRAVHALEALHSPGNADGAEPLRLLVRYALGAEPPQRLSHSAARLRQALRPGEPAQHALRAARWQHAVRCSLAKRMALLDARVFGRNDLLASEQQLGPHLAGFLRPVSGAASVPETLERWQAVVTLIGEQERLLAAADSGWLRGAGSSLGPTHDAVLARVAGIGLLGDAAVQQLRRQSAAALQRMRAQLAKSLGAGSEPALVWREGEGRFVLSPHRTALRDRLAALLQEPFMSPPGAATFPDAPPGALAWDPQRLAGALDLAQARRRFRAEQLPHFPPSARAAVAQVVDRQLARHVEHAAASALLWTGADSPLDPAAWRGQQQQVARVESLLVQLGARDRAQMLRALVAGDVAARLGVAEQAFARSAFGSPRLQDFGWWSGEGSPLLAALGVMDGLTLRHVLAPQVSRLEAAVRHVAPLLAASGGLGEPAVQRWQAAAADLERYRGGRGEGSLAALTRTLVSLGPELTAGNCLERLAAWPAPAGADPFAERHRQLRDALRQRCTQLRAGPRPVQAPEPGADSAWPFG